MSFRLEMLQVARLSPKQLGESAELVAAFLRSQVNADGGFKNRSGESDLYYTVFGLEGLIALGAEPPAATVSSYLRQFGAGSGLDLVHLSCLVRCWADVTKTPPLDHQAVAEHIEAFRTPDGGYNTMPGQDEGTAYGCFLAASAYQDLRRDIPAQSSLIDCVRSLRCDDGGYANQRGLVAGLTPSTAAAATLLRGLGAEDTSELAPWLLSRHHPTGGFFATPFAPVPDLLSTATALHALGALQSPLDKIKEPCLDFLDSLWTNTGGFYGNWTDDCVDCEYTYYGLLALGHLSL